MAGEIAQDLAVMLAIGSATIGAGGAIISQVVAGVISGKRERRKAQADAERWRVEADAKRRDRQLDRKIDLFGELLTIIEELCMWLMGREELIDHKAELRQLKAARQLARISEEIGILEPELYEYAKTGHDMALRALTGHWHSMRKGDLGDDSEQGVGADAPKADEVLADLSIWADLFREAAHSYVSHQPVVPYQTALMVYRLEAQTDEGGVQVFLPEGYPLRTQD
ncbi:hypothetical protein [Pseudarthrobacter siccitolerans]|uniref:hypothetical protein n=1 Tax=Pseudarthrobacter siccitolerans TaxID=861266 RepID=UPI000679BE0E|nr:hypothetical protein [Pseudarthrobacter siccitolerans]